MSTAAPQVSLDERIAAAFAGGATSVEVAELVKEAEAAAVASGEAAEQARTRALDPALSAAEVARARRAMEDAAFARDRLQVAVHRLGDRVKELKWREESDRRQVAYDRVKAERDVLADELARVYPPLAAQLIDLLGRIAANDQQVELINRRLPDRCERLLVAELVARGLGGFMSNSVQAPSIVTAVRLPSFARDRHEPYAWPRSRKLSARIAVPGLPILPGAAGAASGE